MKALKISTIALAALAGVSLTSCLKDKDYDNRTIQAIHPDGTQNFIEIGLTSSDASNFLLSSFNAINTDTVVNLIPVVLASANAAPEDIHVTLTRVDALVSDYNTENGTDYQVPAPTTYTIINPGGVVTIPKGSHVGYLQVKFKPSDFIGGEWAFGFKIASVDKAGYTISGNLATGIFAFGIKNKYDGDYRMRIKTVGWSAYAIADNLPGTWPTNIGLVTAGSSSVTIIDYLRGDNLQPAFSAGATPSVLGAATAFGATSPMYTFDPATDKLVSVVNTTPDDGRGRFLQLNTAITTSRYDASTKTIYAAYIMKQNGRPDMFIYDTLTYRAPRP
jgi:hypothetical protein